MADLKEEVLQHQAAILGVVDLRMELHTIETARLVRDRNIGAHRGMADQCEALGHLRHIVAVAHPGNALRRQALEQLAAGIIEGLRLAILTRGIILCRRDLTAQRMCHQLAAVADAQNRNTQFKDARIAVRRGLLVNAVRTAGEDDADRVHGLDLFQRRFIRFYFTVNMMLAHTARNKLIVLPAKVQHKYKLMMLHESNSSDQYLLIQNYATFFSSQQVVCREFLPYFFICGRTLDLFIENTRRSA